MSKRSSSHTPTRTLSVTFIVTLNSAYPPQGPVVHMSMEEIAQCTNGETGPNNPLIASADCNGSMPPRLASAPFRSATRRAKSSTQPENNTSSSFPRANHQRSTAQRAAKHNLVLAMSYVINNQKTKKAKLHHGEYETRPRQWHEPPVLHYDKYEVYEELQKEIKRIGGQHVDTSSDLTDLDMEVRLLGDYKRWVKAQRTQGEVSDQLLDNGVSKETEFYKNLEQDIEEDRKSVTEEMQMAISRWNGNTFGNSEIIEVVAAVGTLKKRASIYSNAATQ